MAIKGLAAKITNQFHVWDAYTSLRRKITKLHAIILMYHRIGPKIGPLSQDRLDPQIFERQLEYFSRNFEILSLDELVVTIIQRKALPKKAIVISLDDGYKDNYSYAYPLLKKYHVPAIIFLTSGHINSRKLFWWDRVNYAVDHGKVNQLDLDELGNYSIQSEVSKRQAASTIIEKFKNIPDERKNLLIEKLINASKVDIPQSIDKDMILSWDDIKEMSSGGISFGAHSVNHPILTQLTREQAKFEIVQSKRDIEEKLGQPVTAFSYPNGNFDLELLRLVKEIGFACAVSILPSKPISFKDNIYALGRIAPMEDFDQLKVQLCGFMNDLRQISM
jgi:peptidoglycan/xylan/chitin deacetylase (PgdA/CDA1 family)